MAEKEIKITFAGEKLEALSFFLAEQGGKTVEELLKSHLDKSYEKNVPAQVRKFVESRMETLQETANQEQESQRTGGTRQQRASGRRSRETQNQEEQPREPVPETVEETAENTMTVRDRSSCRDRGSGRAVHSRYSGPVFCLPRSRP